MMSDRDLLVRIAAYAREVLNDPYVDGAINHTADLTSNECRLLDALNAWESRSAKGADA